MKQLRAELKHGGLAGLADAAKQGDSNADWAKLKAVVWSLREDAGEMCGAL